AENEAAFEIADLAPVLDACRMEDGFVEADLGQYFSGEEALVPDVMDREERADGEEGGVKGEGTVQASGNQAGLPVVAMQDVRTKNRAADFDRGPCEDGEANVV